MYLYQTLKPEGKRPPGSKVDEYISGKIGEELRNAAAARVTMRDSTSALLQIKGPKQAAAVEKATLHVLRSELRAFPDGLRETARTGYLLDQNIKRKELQDFQCAMLARIEKLLRQEMQRNGVDYRRYKVGGYDTGTYELFFRIQPGRSMTKAQLTTALRRSFGDRLLQSQQSIEQLFDSFDFYRADEMDWRAFLYLLCLHMMPYLFCEDLLRYGYALYSSIGSLDLDCSERLSLSALKDMICAPVILSLRAELRTSLDRAWLQLSDSNAAVFQFAARSQTHASRVDPDEFRVPFTIFWKMLHDTFFAKYFLKALPFGRRDQRMWTCVLEEQYYHPRVLQNLKQLRREERSQHAADEFLAAAALRQKRYCFRRIDEYTQQRVKLRLLLIGVEVRSSLLVTGKWFDRWRAVSMEISARVLLQRCCRGFVARRRRRFLLRLRQRSTLLQSGTRKLLARVHFHHNVTRIRWAATTMQRVFRGSSARKRTATRVQALFDAQRRQLQRERRAWENWRFTRAAVAIQMTIRRFLRRRRQLLQLAEQARIAAVQRQMQQQHEQQRVQQHVYMSQISDWYIARKQQYDSEVFNEQQTLQQKKAIRDRRSLFAKEAALLAKQQREEKLRRLEEEATTRWNTEWEAEIKRRSEAKRVKLANILLLPESQAELLLKKELEKRIRGQIKDVLRRADKQKIPMEVPEAKEIAAKEVIEQEVEREIIKTRVEMQVEERRLQQEKQQKLLKEQNEALMDKKRKRKWALLTMQGYVRAFLARKRARERAYKRYVKHFDSSSHEYYYEDKRTRRTTWKKPTALGNYDLPMDSYWIAIPAGDGDMVDLTAQAAAVAAADDGDNNNRRQQQPVLRYFYNPSTWKQQWEQPFGTVLCEQCGVFFAAARMCSNSSSSGRRHSSSRRGSNISYDSNGSYDSNNNSESEQQQLRLKRCERCFHALVQQLLQQQQLRPKDIRFKLFNGGREDARWLKFAAVAATDWHAHLLTIDPKLLSEHDDDINGGDRALLKDVADNSSNNGSRSRGHKKHKKKSKSKPKQQQQQLAIESNSNIISSGGDDVLRLPDIDAHKRRAKSAPAHEQQQQKQKKKKKKKRKQRESKSAGADSSVISALSGDDYSSSQHPHSAAAKAKAKARKKKSETSLKVDSSNSRSTEKKKKKKKKKSTDKKKQQLSPTAAVAGEGVESNDLSSWMSPLSGDSSIAFSPTSIDSSSPLQQQQKKKQKLKKKSKTSHRKTRDTSATAAEEDVLSDSQLQPSTGASKASIDSRRSAASTAETGKLKKKKKKNRAAKSPSTAATVASASAGDHEEKKKKKKKKKQSAESDASSSAAKVKAKKKKKKASASAVAAELDTTASSGIASKHSKGSKTSKHSKTSKGSKTSKHSKGSKHSKTSKHSKGGEGGTSREKKKTRKKDAMSAVALDADASFDQL